MTEIQTKADEVRALIEGDGDAPPPVATRDDDASLGLARAFSEEPADDGEDDEPRPVKPRKKVTPKATPRPSSKLARFLPDAERVKIWKRNLGKRTYVRDYSLRDLAHAQDIETFIQTYIVPTFGEGDYDVDSVSPQGQITRTVTLSVMDPRKTPPGVSAADSTLGPVVDRLLSRIDALQHSGRETPPKSIVEQVKELSQVQEMLGGQGPDAMMLWMLTQQQRQPDASAELAELRAELRALREKPAAPPPPPPPPLPAEAPLDVAGIIREATAASRPAFDIAELAALLRPDKSGVGDIVAALMQVAPLLEKMLGSRSDAADQLRQREMELLREQLRELKTQPSRGIRDVIEDMSAVTQFMGAVRKGPAREESFWSFLSNLVHQFPSTVESLGGLVERLREDEARGQRVTHALPPQRVPPVAPASRPRQFPDDFRTFVQAIEDAPDDPGRIGATLAAFQRLGQSPAWKAYLQKVMALAKSGNTGEATKFLRSFLEGLRDAELLSQATVDACVRAFETHWDKVAETLGGKASA